MSALLGVASSRGEWHGVECHVKESRIGISKNSEQIELAMQMCCGIFILICEPYLLVASSAEGEKAHLSGFATGI